jgi:nucleoside phosphorylase
MGVVPASPAPHDPSHPLDLRACREAARSVRASPYWRQVRDVVRPREVSIHRSRPPLALMLYAAARDGRLVWRAADEFAVLEPPIARMRDWARGDAGRTWLARLDRWWEMLVWLGTPLLLIVLAVPTAFIPVVGLAAAMLLLLLATVFVTAQMIVGLLRGLLHLRVPRVENARDFHWTVTLCHVADPTRVDRLFRAALNRSKALAAAHVRPDVADGTHVVTCPERGITTAAARAAAATAPSVVRADPDRSGVLVVRDGGDFRPPDPDAQRPFGFVPLLLACVAVTVAVEAAFLADAEREACRDTLDCTRRPATWLDAAAWLLSRMVFQDRDRVAATLFGQWLGFLMPFLSIVVVLCLVVAGRRRVRYTRKRRELRYQHLRTTVAGSVRLLVLVVLDIEREAVINAVAEAGGSRAAPDTTGGHAIFRLGRLGQTEIILAQATQGTVTPAAMMLTANRLIEQLRPDYVVLSGICFGLWSRELDGGEQELGDVVVSAYVQNVDHRRVSTEGGVERTLWRGERVQATRELLSAFRAATHGWEGPRVHVGTVLSANVLSDSAAFRADLRREFPEASAGEMELTGLYAAAANDGCGWIMAKGISDWGAGGLTDDTRRAASGAAAAFIVHAITYGTLPAPRRDRPASAI